MVEQIHEDVDTELTSEADEEFPFRTELSLCRLIEFWEEAETGDDPVRRALARVIRDALAQAPELREPITDLAVLDRHRPVVDALMSAAFPPSSWDQDFAAALAPFRLRSVYATPSFERLLQGKNGVLRGRMKLGTNMDMRAGLALRLLHAYAHVLRRFYDIKLSLDAPLIFTVRDPDTGLDRHFKESFDSRFIATEALGPIPVLDEEARARLLANLSDPWVMRELIPPDHFVFRGFALFRAVEVTDQEIVSSLKRDLIERESIVSATVLGKIQDRLRALFRQPGLEFSLAAIDGEQVFLLSASTDCGEGCLFADSKHYRISDFDNSIYERAAAQGQPLFIEDLRALPAPGPIERKIMDGGLRSLVVAPLYYQEKLIGMLELSSPRPGDLNQMQGLKLQEVLPLFSIAVKRGMDELNTRVQAFIKEQYTAIHPAVEWRFRRAALHALEGAGPDGPEEVEPIVFEQVYPLYAATDIRGSSTLRGLAIQGDLATHLQLALDVVRSAHRAKDLPILDEVAYQIDQLIEQITSGLRSGDELSVLSFIQQRVEPIFPVVQGVGGDVRARLDAYRAALDSRLGTVYQRRKSFDESVGMINDALASYLDTEEDRAQAMYPHYFEKQRTDGVEWGLYVGGSLLESGAFDPLQLRNLRLWQLMVLCGMARRSEALKQKMPVALDTTHLVLAHHAPLAIRFRLDEKRFDVDGAYNVRYEVIKKRIDKASLKGRRERLTQPGAIAVVYAQVEEAAEYREYFEYLQSRGEVSPGVEEVELEALPGADGLRALRVGINLAYSPADRAAALTR